MALPLNTEPNEAEHDDASLHEESTNDTEAPHDAASQPKKVDEPPISRDTLVSIPSTPRIRRRLLPLTLSIIYTFLMLIFWITTAILCTRPIKGSGWHDSYSFFAPCWFQDAGEGGGFGCQKDILDIGLQMTINDRWRRMTRMLSSVLSVVAIPISSAICSRGAVVYLQNRKQQSFAFHKAIILADKGWSDPNVLASVLLDRKRRAEISRYLLLSVLICALGFLIWPLQEMLVTLTPVQLVTDFNLTATQYIPDADIAGLSQVASRDTISTTKAAIDRAGVWDTLPKLWTVQNNACSISAALSPLFNPCNNPKYGFVSNIVNSVNTGVFENHSFRFNSSINCTNITESEYPRPCPGFTTSSVMSQPPEGEKQIFEVCAPGDMHKFPWNITRNRQDIEEEVYIHFNSAAASSLSSNNLSTSFTQRCTAQTTAGYFSLPNHKKPDSGPLLKEFNLTQSDDPRMAFPPYGTGWAGPDIPADRILGEQYLIPNSPGSPAIGPLLTATMSLFGSSTFFSTRANATGNMTALHNSPADVDNCTDVVPFHDIASLQADWQNLRPGNTTLPLYPMNLCASTDPSAYTNDLRTWLFDFFLDTENYLTELVFTHAVFYANQANLEQAASQRQYRRMIMIDPGIQAQRLEAHPASIALLTIIIVLHLAGVLGVALYSSRTPTWTATLDTFAMLQLGLNR